MPPWCRSRRPASRSPCLSCRHTPRPAGPLPSRGHRQVSILTRSSRTRLYGEFNHPAPTPLSRLERKARQATQQAQPAKPGLLIRALTRHSPSDFLLHRSTSFPARERRIRLAPAPTPSHRMQVVATVRRSTLIAGALEDQHSPSLFPPPGHGCVSLPTFGPARTKVDRHADRYLAHA
jgi:hypothetical protein